MVSQCRKWVNRAAWGLLFAALAGCAQHPGPHALPPAPMVLPLAGGGTAPARAWLPPGACQGVILALHGFTDSRDAWELAAPDFAAAGWAVVAPDLRGFGGTASRGQWAGTGQLVADVAAELAALRARHPGKRLVLMGESMGGAIAALVAAGGQDADATVLLAPAVLSWQQLGWPATAVLRAADALAPAWAPDPGRAGVHVLASDNIEALLRMGRDPLTLRAPSVAMTRGLVDLMSEAAARFGAMQGPVLVLSGEHDQLVPAPSALAAWQEVRGKPNVRLGAYPGGYHLLLRDRGRALVVADILAWLGDPAGWLPSGADAAAAAWEAGGGG